MHKIFGVLALAVGLAGSGLAAQQAKPLKPEALQVTPVRIAGPQITEVKGKCLYHTGELDVIGLRLGDAQGIREVVLNGIPRDVMFWQKTVVRVSHMYDFPAGQMVKVFLRDKGTGDVLSNVFEFFNLFCIYSVTPPADLSPGAQVEIKVKPGMGAGAQGRVVVVGGKQAQIVSWTNDTVTFKVPALQPGDYKIHIKKAGNNLAYECPITVK
jgi:hypothetical protein